MQTSNDLGTAFLDVLTFASDRIAEYQDRAAWDAISHPNNVPLLS